MNITYLGTGSAFTLKNYQTNFLFEHNGKRMLFDAGMTLPHALNDLNLSYKDIDALYITHLHSDHIAGTEYLAFTTYFDPTVTEKITLIGNNELIRELWNHSLRGGLKSIQGKKMSLDEYFDVVMVKKNKTFMWEGIEFNIVQTVHIMDEYSIVPSFGLMFTEPASGKKIFCPGDTQFNPEQIKTFYEEADYIIQDCETTPFKSGVHANFMDLETLPDDIKKKMALVHYQDNVLDDNGDISEEWMEKWEKAGFSGGYGKGFIKKGDTVVFGEREEKDDVV